jgi:hypothetical protein
MLYIQMIYCYVIVTLILKFLFYFLGKVFPKLHRRRERHAISLSTSDDDTNLQQNIDEDTSSTNDDYVFRIIFYSDR